jgi:putative flippase GtrA
LEVSDFSAKMNDVTIIVPVYNEAENIRTAVERIEAAVRMPHTVTLVYDTDDDNTIPAAKELSAIYGNIGLVKNKYGRGALNAIKTGLEAADGVYAVVTMADLSDPPDVINAMFDIAERENADIVCASRYMPGGKQIGGPVIKGLLSRIAGLTLHKAAKVPTHDATNSFKLYRVSFLRKQTIESSGGFELGIELVAKAHVQGCRIAETPTTWTSRVAGKSNFKLARWLKNYLHWYFYAFNAPQNGIFRFLPRLIAYAAVGFVCALINWGIFYLLHYAAYVPYLPAGACAFIVSSTVNYGFCGLIFLSRGRKKPVEYALVLAASAIALSIDLSVMYILVERAQAPAMAAKVIGTASAFFFNYASRQFFIFEHKNS